MSNTITTANIGPRRTKAAYRLIEMAYCRLMGEQTKMRAAYLDGAPLDLVTLDGQLAAAEQEIAELRTVIARASKQYK